MDHVIMQMVERGYERDNALRNYLQSQFNVAPDKSPDEALQDLYATTGRNVPYKDFVHGVQDSALSWQARHRDPQQRSQAQDALAAQSPVAGFDLEPVEGRGWQEPPEGKDIGGMGLHAAVHNYDTARPLVPFQDQPAHLPRPHQPPTYEGQAAPPIRFIDAEEEAQAKKSFFDELRKSPQFEGKDDQEIFQFLLDVFSWDHPGAGLDEFHAFLNERVLNYYYSEKERERIRKRVANEQEA